MYFEISNVYLFTACVVPCGDYKTSPCTSFIVEIISDFCPFRSKDIYREIRSFFIGLDSYFRS